MNLINNINPVFSLRGRILNLLPDIPDIFHAVIGRRVDLHHIHGRSFRNRPADGTLPAWASICRIFTVYCSGKNLGYTGLSGAARSAEQIRMADAA